MNSENFVVIQGWMCNELELKGNDLLIYALIYGFSQDGETEYSGGRNYIAKTFNISLPTVDKALKNLISRDLIIKICNEQNGVLFVSYKISLPVVKKLYGGSKETLHNNIVKNKSENGISKEIPSEPKADDFVNNFGKREPKKQNLYEKCSALIHEFTNIPSIEKLLFQYLDFCMEIQSIRGANQWKGMLNTLDKVQVQCHPHTYEEIIQNTLEHGWRTFYPITDNKKTNDVQKNVEMITPNDYDNYSHTKSQRSF